MSEGGKVEALPRDHFRGALVGTAVGDALGMPLEGWSRERILRRHGTVREMLHARLGRGTLTDDTHLTAALARAILDAGGWVEVDHAARRFAEAYDPSRGYGGNARRILEGIAAGEPWPEVVERFRLPGGSWANGAAMRVAPVALASPGDPERVRTGARLQAKVTGHTHPVGRSGAELQALAVREALIRGGASPTSGLRGFVNAVRKWADEWPKELEQSLTWIARHRDASSAEVVAEVGTGARASRSVPAALWAFLSTEGDPEETVVKAVNLGGDTDTVGAMAGALAGAFSGMRAIPDRWLETLEEGAGGRSDLQELADRIRGIVTGDSPAPNGRR